MRRIEIDFGLSNILLFATNLCSRLLYQAREQQ